PSFYTDPSLLWNAQPSAAAPATLSISGNKLTIQVASSYKGTFTVQATASDGSLSASQTFAVTSINVAPVFNPIGTQNLSIGQSATISLNATDANGDPISFSARVVSGTPSTPAATLTISGNQLTVTPPAGFIGSFVVEVAASDGSLSSKQSFTV